MSKELALSLLNKCFPDLEIVKLDKQVSLASLWAGMGSIVKLEGSSANNTKATAIVKLISFPPGPRAGLSIGDSRKAASYEVEAAFYTNFSMVINKKAGYCIVPQCLHADNTQQSSGKIHICMTELPGPTVGRVSASVCESAIRGIAMLHATWWGGGAADAAVSKGLQPQGGYWYLDTRPDEYKDISKSGWTGRLRKAAKPIDKWLKSDPMQCIIHGDLKNCNMSLDEKRNEKTDGFSSYKTMSFCDFQYVGKASPMKDLAYFFTASVEDSLINDDNKENHFLGLYREELLVNGASSVPPLEHMKVALSFAYADYARFMAGWGWWGNVRLVEGKVKNLLDMIDGGTELTSEGAYTEAINKLFPPFIS